ncbi:Rz1-like lysis system protein LysC [Candidatus Pantoea formicae]|uniref:Rz1-like lysis system protein LysC n=1 Tax=Candidatus Pantoea formicae TaxID=2608355 RepID=UPI003F516A9A
MLCCLFPALLLSSCVRTEIKYVDTPPAPIPESLLNECPIPEIPEGFTWGNSLELNERLLTALDNCNNDKAAIQEIEHSRAEKSHLNSGQ